MKKIFGIIILVIGLILIYRNSRQVSQPIIQKPTISIQPSIVKNENRETKSIFIPYWNVPGISDDLSQYDQLLYFGIQTNESEIDENDLGFKNLSSFNLIAKDKEKILVLRMLDTDNNIKILNNIENQQNIIKETIAIAHENNFEGVALDLEISSLLLTDVTSQINKFVQKFYTQAKRGSLLFNVILYGDLFYRKRPFDVSFINNNSDEIMVMAYDFHKSIGEPGPNYPYNEFKQMIDNYLQFVPAEKLNIIFGMYGYDWTVDEKKRPIKPAKALSLNDINANFIDKCKWQDCLVKRDDISKETEIDYIAPGPEYHIVWFEDEKSVNDKKNYLKEKGINKVGYWVWGYF